MLLTEGDWGSENQNLVWLSYLRSPRNQSKSVRHLVRQSWKRPSSLVWSDSSVVSAPSVSLPPPLLLSPSRSPIGLGTWIKGGERERGRAAEEGREEAREREGERGRRFPLPSRLFVPGGPIGGLCADGGGGVAAACLLHVRAWPALLVQKADRGVSQVGSQTAVVTFWSQRADSVSDTAGVLHTVRMIGSWQVNVTNIYSMDISLRA